MVSAHGRVYSIVNVAPPGTKKLPGQWFLRCRNGFNGVLQWKVPMEKWGWRAWAEHPRDRFHQPTYLARSLVATGERVFVTPGFNSAVRAMDAATGRTLRTYENTSGADELLVNGDTLIAAVHERKLSERRKAWHEASRSSDDRPVFRKRIVAVDVDSGEVLWQSDKYVGVNANRGFLGVHRHLNPVVGEEDVFLVTRDSLVALDLRTGEQKWTASRPKARRHSTRYELNANDMVTLVYHSGKLFFAQLEPRQRLGWKETIASAHAFSAASGKKLWSRPCASWGWGIEPDLFVTNGLVWVWGRGESPLLGLEPGSGRIVRKLPEFKTFRINHHHRCYRNKATSRFLLTSWRGLEYIPWQKEREASYGQWWFRAGCRHGFLPANGLIYNSPNPCVCYLDAKLGGFNALAPERSTPRELASVPDAERLEEGPAYPARPGEKTSPEEEWPAYRHDMYRSGSTHTKCPAEPEEKWSVKLDDRPTPAVIGGGKVFVAVPDGFGLRALDAASGDRLWSFTTAGRVDTPPTYYRGYLFFGCSDGHVYCVRAEDGRLVWKFLAARGRRRVMSEGRPESAWPVHGSLIVDDGKVYVIAGRSTFLDGGIAGWVLDAVSGRVVGSRRWETVGKDPRDRDVKVGSRRAEPGFASDVTVSDGRSIYVKRRALFKGVLDGHEKRPLVSPDSGFLDRTWFNRASEWRVGNRAYGEVIVSGPERVFAFAAYGELGSHSRDGSFVRPGQGAFRLFCRPRPGGGSANEKSGWKRKLSTGVKAMAGAGSRLVAGGWPDRVPEDDPWKYMEGRGPGRLLVLRAADGQTLSEAKLPAPPVMDGISAASGRLYVATQNGRLLCFGR